MALKWQAESLDLGDRSEIVVEFPVTVNQVGLHRCTLTVAGDRFEPDNTRYFTIRVEPPMRILCIIGESGSGQEDKAYWFRSALAQQATAPFQVDVIDPQGLMLRCLGILCGCCPDERGKSGSGTNECSAIVCEGRRRSFAGAGRPG